MLFVAKFINKSFDIIVETLYIYTHSLFIDYESYELFQLVLQKKLPTL